MTSTLLAETSLDTATAPFFRVLGDPTRIAILELLLDEPRSVSELVEALECPQSRVSNHLACLRWCEFVDADRDGRRVTYRIRDRRIRSLLVDARAIASEHCEHLSSCSRIGPEWV